MNTVVRMRSGSRVYGTDQPASDSDYKAVYLPAGRDILLQRVPPVIRSQTKADAGARNTAGDVDVEIYSLQRYMTDLVSGQPVALSMLFTPDAHLVERTDLWDEIRRHRGLWLHRDMKPMLNFCRSGVKRAAESPKPGDEEKHHKGLSHVLRVCLEAEELFAHGTISYPRPEAPLLVRIRNGQVPGNDVAQMIAEAVRRLEDGVPTSALPAAPDHSAAETLVVEQYRRTVLADPPVS